MLFGSLIDLLCDRFGVERTDSSRGKLGDKINLAYRELGNIVDVDWKHLQREGEIVTVPNYTTGTCAVTNGSRTVSFTGATLTPAMAGRYFKCQGSNQWYRIVSVDASASTATLLSPIQESTSTGLTFIIWKRFYSFPSEVRRVLFLGKWISNGEIEQKSYNRIHQENSDISLTGEPEEFVMFGEDTYSSEYSTGTISLIENSNIATGTGTAFLANVEAGDLLIVSGQYLRVKRIESDTRIVLLNFAGSTLTDQSYVIRKESNLSFQLWFSPNQALVLPYLYTKRVYAMVNQAYDKPELPEEFDLAILDGAEFMRYKDANDARWTNTLQLYTSRIIDLKSTRFVAQPKSRQMVPRIRNRGGYLGG